MDLRVDEPCATDFGGLVEDVVTYGFIGKAETTKRKEIHWQTKGTKTLADTKILGHHKEGKRLIRVFVVKKEDLN